MRIDENASLNQQEHLFYLRAICRHQRVVMTIMPSNNADVSASNLREVMSHYLTGVTIVTITKPDGTPYGLTVNSFNSVSLVPPLILWSLDNKNSNLAFLKIRLALPSISWQLTKPIYVGALLAKTVTDLLVLTGHLEHPATVDHGCAGPYRMPTMANLCRW